MSGTEKAWRFITGILILPLLLAGSLLFNNSPADAGTIAGTFTTLTASPMNITAFTVDPTTGLMYGQGDQSSKNYYRYDPIANTWSTLASCPQDSGNNGGAAYLEGKIYITYCGYTVMTVYDIASNTWSTVTGGLQSGNIASDGIDIYISASGTFKKWDVSDSRWVSLTPTTTQAWGGLQYRNGYLYSHFGNGTNGFKRYNISTNASWETLTSVPGPAVLGSAIFDAYYYCMGDYGGTNLYSYDLGAAEWNNTLTLPFSINDASIVVYDNSLYIIQGEAGTGFSRFTPNNPILSNIEGTSAAYSIGNAPVVITSTITGADNDDTEFESGTVSITGNYETGKDLLSFTNQLGIAGSWNATGGILSLTGSASIADWVTALRSVTYSNNGPSSNNNTRTISFQVRDEEHNSNVQSRHVAIVIPAPSMDVRGNGVSISDGDSSPSSADHTNFGGIDTDTGAIVRTFTIINNGTANLILSDTPMVAIGGTNAGDFSVTTQPSSPIIPGANTAFQVTFDPSSTGTRAATISVANNDTAKNPYNFSIQGTGTKLLTVSGVTASDKVYDGSTNATINTVSASLVGVTSGDNVTLNTNSANGTFADKNAGTGKIVTVSGLSLTGDDAVDYALTQPTATANITPKTITVDASGVSKTYDGTTAANVTLSDNRLNGDTLTPGYTSAAFAGRNVGTGMTITVSGIYLGGADAGNYSLSGTTASTSANIAARNITVTAATESRVYNCTANSTGAPSVTSGSLASGDTGNWTQSFADKNAGTNKTITPEGTVSDNNSGLNYNVTFAPVATGTISAKTLNVSGVTADSRVYDGTANATCHTGSASLTGTIEGDNVTLDSVSANASFPDKHAGSARTVIVSGLALGGSDAPNYSLTQPSPSANINLKGLTVSGLTASNKVYDGTTNATLNTGNTSLVGVIPGDTVNLDTGSVTGNFSDASPGSSKTVTVYGLTISGTDAGEYSLSQPSAAADITTPEISIQGNSVEIVSGDTTAAISDFTDFGNVNVASGSVIRSFVISNNGSSALNLTATPRVSISGAQAADFTVTVQPDVQIASGNSSSFQVTFDPAIVGVCSAVVSVICDDIDENPYTFAIKGSGFTPAGTGGGSAPAAPVPVTTVAPFPASAPSPVTTYSSVEYARPIAKVNTVQQPAAFDGHGNSLTATGSLITVSGYSALTVNIPVALNSGEKLGSFTDAAGLTYKDNRLEIPASSAVPGGKSLLRISDESGDLGTKIIIETGDCIGSGDQACAKVLAIKSSAGFAVKDFTAQNPSLGEVASTVALDLATLPDGAQVKITTSMEPDPAAASAFQLAVVKAGLSDISIAYTINIEKTNLQNGTDIRSASITMAAGKDWVEANGGTGSVQIIRYDPATGTQQVLKTSFLGYDAEGRAIFEGASPDGLSIFGLTGIKQPVVVTTTVNQVLDAKKDSSGIWWATGLAILAAALFIWYLKRKKRKNSPA
jgi:hypothetical protein